MLGITAITAPASPARAVACTSTGFFRDGINLTAALINPSVTVSGEVNAAGCNVGVYFGPGTTGSVLHADVHSANYFGVVVQRASVNVSASSVHDIGESPFNGTQHGVAIYYATVDNGSSSAQPACTSGATTGTVSGNTVWNYQKGGVVVNCTGSSVQVSNNNVTGFGPVTFIAQNGIQISRGATGGIKNNKVSGNQYSGTNNASSAGVLIFGGCGSAFVTNVSVAGNTLTNNDVGIYFFNDADTACVSLTAPSTQTKNSAVNNTITNSAVTNISGNGDGCGYQAGISDLGNHDSLQNNKISGLGYTSATCTAPGPGAWVFPVDQTGSVDTRMHNNTSP